ncbi:demethylmenaquinone methyltransferase / 2-methoxy-6-polyprenyl-1,4-benzoquinol methylase [Austwickia chelonae]|uniref:Demethylmenaquinone methyltransferase n=1 Tax=Austwickia chelonae NBRC 105200 TaxID=1184607 RepID=K6VRU4_9MICO|nr:demethylmenaquinone methyltransferase [Austwickia chelonae]GAB78045.1 demethylmenaquinone methyltransferase [Austwickia chelonae NBRC 105200]SEV95070.1 demethylmenaquinone methyltransferase / 2-methoxy-6-polyprenyl-1,4-benzoquinol methylase [Austwickia chelonae]
MNRASLDKQPRDVASMFDQVASRYDLMNDLMTGGIARLWRRALVAAVDARPGQRVLDIAAGTGTSSMPFYRAGVQVVPADFSLGMLRQGRRQHPELPFVAADATRLPFADASFDAVTMSYGLRNVQNFRGALAEFARVTRPGGRLVVNEFSQPVNPLFRRVYQEYLMGALPAMAARFSSNPESYVYLAESIQSWPCQEELAVAIQEAGWRDVQWRNLNGGIVALHRAVRG